MKMSDINLDGKPVVAVFSSKLDAILKSRDWRRARLEYDLSLAENFPFFLTQPSESWQEHICKCGLSMSSA